MGRYSDYLALLRGAAPPASPQDEVVRVYAQDGSLRTLQSDGTDAPIGGGGGSASFELVTDPNTFQVVHEIDLGGPRVVAYVATLLSVDWDGQPPGSDSGTAAADISNFDASPDLILFEGAGAQDFAQDDPYTGAGDDLPLVTHRGWGVTPRYVKFIAHIMDGSSFDTWEGSGHPTATWQIVVTSS